MENTQNLFSSLHISAPCPMSWKHMETHSEGKFCKSCSQTVYDFSESSDAEFLRVYEESGGKICGSFRKDQLGGQSIVRKKLWEKIVFASLTVLAYLGFSVSPLQGSAKTLINPHASIQSTLVKTDPEKKKKRADSVKPGSSREFHEKKTKKRAMKSSKRSRKGNKRIMGCPKF